jgi:hypothetical protein
MLHRCTAKSILTRLLFALLLSPGFLTNASAKCSTNSCLTGVGNCYGWCFAHNKVSRNVIICENKCDDYWHDGASIGRSDPNPTDPPRRVVGPVPVTTVGPPTREPRPVQPVQPVKPVGISNPNKPGSGNDTPVILERKNDSGRPEHNDSGGRERGR